MNGGKNKKVRIGSLPCNYVKITAHRGAHIDCKELKIAGFYSEDTEEIFGEGFMRVLVTNPNRILYD